MGWGSPWLMPIASLSQATAGTFGRASRQVTVKVPALTARLPGVSTRVLPVFAPVGTVAVMWA